MTKNELIKQKQELETQIKELRDMPINYKQKRFMAKKLDRQWHTINKQLEEL
jgi:hypothetical protein